MLGLFETLGLGEILIIVAAVLLLFGAKRLPEIGRSMGRGLREFKDSVGGKDNDEPAELPVTTTPAETPARERDTVS